MHYEIFRVVFVIMGTSAGIVYFAFPEDLLPNMGHYNVKFAGQAGRKQRSRKRLICYG
jgi:hypothetical protein